MCDPVDRQRTYNALCVATANRHMEITKRYPRDMRAGNRALTAIVEAIRLDLESLQDFRRGSPLRQRALALIAASPADLEGLHAARMRAAIGAPMVDVEILERRVYARRLWRARSRA